MKNAFISTLLLLCAAAGGCADRTDLKGIALGATIADVRATHPGVECHEDNQGVGDCIYFSRGTHQKVESLDTLAGMATNSWTISFYRGKVISVFVLLPPASFEQVTHALQEKFGEPIERKARNGSPDLELELEWGMRDGTVRAALLSLSTGRVMRVTMKSHEAENIIARANASRRSGKSDI